MGAGGGRDAAAPAGRGHRVVAVEPTAGFRAEGRRPHADRGTEWVDDALPAPRPLRGRRFDLVTPTAVWTHLDEDERSTAMPTVSRLVGRGGRAVLSRRHGPVPAGRRHRRRDGRPGAPVRPHRRPPRAERGSARPAGRDLEPPAPGADPTRRRRPPARGNPTAPTPLRPTRDDLEEEVTARCRPEPTQAPATIRPRARYGPSTT
ncbi:methyltransferase domain-containing protein [Streptomyces sp. URMC 126]|uniref:methyltransferase domain-containing protein n=1 Tax=Streptomyces sp. URMC 126 TaxID=3423401 RepID=UPI003F19C501